jgi:hypothetical protein
MTPSKPPSTVTPSASRARHISSIARYLLMGLTGIMVVGCASKTYLVESEVVPKGASRIVLVRKGSIVGGAQKPKVFDPGRVYNGEKVCAEPETKRFPNGWLVGKLGNGKSLRWNRVAGPMWLSMKILGADGWVLEPPISTEPSKEYTIEVGTLSDMQNHKPPKVIVRDIQEH